MKMHASQSDASAFAAGIWIIERFKSHRARKLFEEVERSARYLFGVDYPNVCNVHFIASKSFVIQKLFRYHNFTPLMRRKGLNAVFSLIFSVIISINIVIWVKFSPSQNCAQLTVSKCGWKKSRSIFYVSSKECTLNWVKSTEINQWWIWKMSNCAQTIYPINFCCCCIFQTKRRYNININNKMRKKTLKKTTIRWL